jgi:glycine/D-amino acid oxidase-like deaminating enzyme
MSADISLLVVGGGPAGTTAALQASELGGQVTLLEAGQVGGTSLNRGPAPGRTLARAARLARDRSSAETGQTVAACMAGAVTIEQVAELQLAFPTFTEGVSMAAQKICRTLGIGRFPQAWSYLGAED